MTFSSVNRVLPLLAASGLSISEARDFFAWVKRLPIEDTTKVYQQIRNQIRNLDLDQIDDDYTSNTKSQYASVVKDVQRLLKETDYTAPEATRLILNELIERYPGENFREHLYNPKSGFRRWIERLVRAFGEQAVLSAALQALGTKTRSQSDWRLG